MKFSFFRKKNNQPGFSLIEIIVSVALFVAIILSTTEIFRLVIVGQRKAIASQNVQESLKYFLETSSKEIRMARKNEGHCGVTAPFNFLGNDDIYALAPLDEASGDALIFRNFYDECVVYYLGKNQFAGRFIVRRGGVEAPISPAKVNISQLAFRLENYNFSLPESRPLLIMKIIAKAYSGNLGDETYRELADLDMQTSLTSRFYR